MKFSCVYLLSTIALMLPISEVQSQNLKKKEDWKYMHMLSSEELSIPARTIQTVQATAAPVGTVESLAEFEPMSGVMVAYPFGIPFELIVEFARQDTVFFVVNNATDEAKVKENCKVWSENSTHCKFIQAAHDSYWVRDYGPMFIAGKDSIAIVDFLYNRNRVNDDLIPQKLAATCRFPYFSMNVVHTGGNYMSDGYGVAASSQLVYSENTITKEQLNQQMKDYLGISTYHVLEDPNNTYINHIDCWGKFLDVDKVLIRSVPANHPQYTQIEQVASYFKNQKSSWRTNYQVFRVNTPKDEPYSNSFILNKKVYVPMMGTEWDNAALEVYRKAMPGYVVMGFTGNWYSTDAIHCRVHEMANRQMVRIKHVPIKGAQVNQTQFNLEATIKAYSGKPLNNDSLLVYYKVGSEAWKTVRLFPKSGDTYSAQLPLAAKDQTVQYYLFASDLAGKRSTLPVVGASAPFVFASGDVFTENQALQTRSTTKIYPNPVNDWLAVSMENEPNDQTIRMEVYSANGQLIKTIKEPVRENIFLDFRSFKTGIYTLRIIGTNGAEIFKVVKK